MSQEHLKSLREKAREAFKEVNAARTEIHAAEDSDDAAKRNAANEKYDTAWSAWETANTAVEEYEAKLETDQKREDRYQQAADRMNNPQVSPAVRSVYSSAEGLEDEDRTYSRAFYDAILFGTDTPAETRQILQRGQSVHRVEMLERLRDQGVDVTRALASQSGAGANVMPTTLLDQIILYAAGSMPFNATSETPASYYETPDAGPFEVPNVDDTANTATDPGETTAVTGHNDPQPQKLTLNATKTDSGVIDLAEALLMSDVVGLEDAVGRLLATRVSRRVNVRATDLFIAAAGAGGLPTGRRVDTAAANALTVSEMEDLVLQHLDEASQTSPNLFIMFNSQTRAILYKERNNGVKAWQEGVGGAVNGPPTTLAGARVWMNTAFPASPLGAADRPIAVAGDGSHVHLRVANGGIDVRRSTPGGYGFANDVVGVKAVVWADEGLTATKAFALLERAS